MEQRLINSFDGTPISVRIWNEAESPKGIIQIIHDIGEHSGRYIEFASKLQEKGYIVFCPDLRAFGLTEPKDGLGYHDGNIFHDTLSDIIFLKKYFSREYNLSVFIAGFGYGGYLVQALLEKEMPLVGVIISSAGIVEKFSATFGKIATITLSKKKKSSLFNLRMQRYNNQFKQEKGQKLWITSDTEMRKDYLADPLCDSSPSNNFCYNLFKGLSLLNNEENIPQTNKKIPIAFFAGRKDPNTGKKASKVIAIYKKYKKLGFGSIRLFIYENARHCVLSEVDRACYTLHMLNFIDRCFSSNS